MGDWLRTELEQQASMDKAETKGASSRARSLPHVGLLTGGQDASYAHGLTAALVARGVRVDFIGSDQLDAPFLHSSRLVRFLNLRGEQRENVSFHQKIPRLVRYYAR